MSTNGFYSVKTSYQSLCDEISHVSTLTSMAGPPKSFWKKLWKLRALNKVKTFLWKACTNSLPTKCNLVHRKILSNSTCCLCLKEPESSLHATWECELLRLVWQRSFSGLINSGQGVGSAVELVELVQENKLNLELFAMTCWTLWNLRNKVWLDELGLPLDQIVDHAFNILQEFQRAHLALPKPFRPTRPS